jgi:hypothetical protein
MLVIDAARRLQGFTTGDLDEAAIERVLISPALGQV